MDGRALLWRVHQRAIPAKLPAARTVVHFILTGTGGSEGWLELARTGATVCKDDQGHEVDLVVEGDTGQLLQWLLGRVMFRELLSAGQVRLVGPSRLARSFPTWFDVSMFADALRRAEVRRAATASA